MPVLKAAVDDETFYALHEIKARWKAKTWQQFFKILPSKIKK